MPPLKMRFNLHLLVVHLLTSPLLLQLLDPEVVLSFYLMG